MSSIKYLKIHHGPNEALYTFVHRPQRVYALRDVLRRLGYRVDLVPSHTINYCMIEMCGYNIFQCNINGLAFNQSYKPNKPDPVMHRAIKAVLAATSMLERADNYHWIHTKLENEVCKINSFGSQKEWYPFKLCQKNQAKETASLDNCIECCRGIDCSGLCLVRQDWN